MSTPLLPYSDPPCHSTLETARRDLATHRNSLALLNTKIQSAEDELARIIQQSTSAIRQFQSDRANLELTIAHTLAYLSPIRRLPNELLRLIFYINFEDHPCCAWVLAAVCRSWRRLALSMPRIWSKIRLITAQDASADIVRLWLERSGQNIPLDIEIFLRSPPPSNASPSRRRRDSGQPLPVWPAQWDEATWPAPQPPVPVATFVDFAAQGIIPLALPANAVNPAVPNLPQRTISPPSQVKPKSNTHWGYVAFFYLTEQIHRWERFVFRFDKKFTSIASLENIVGDAPLLKEFEVSCGDPTMINDWTWLPSSKAKDPPVMPELRSVTLQYVPFKWSTPILTSLRQLTLRALPGFHVTLDRILYIISQSPGLESLSLAFMFVNPAVLPLVPTVLQDLKTFKVGGHYHLGTLMDSLSLPALETLVIDVEGRDPVEDTITNLVARSHNPRLKSLSLAYGILGTPGVGFYYTTHSLVTSWGFLRNIDSLQSLFVGGAGMGPLLNALASPDDDHNGQDRWLCPNLTTLALRNCHTQSESVSKLVQMVNARNVDPAGGHTAVAANGVVPTRLKRLEVHECVVLGSDVQAWLKKRVDDVICTEPATVNSPRSPSPYHDM